MLRFGVALAPGMTLPWLRSNAERHGVCATLAAKN